jgi:hypothetical protein
MYKFIPFKFLLFSLVGLNAQDSTKGKLFESNAALIVITAKERKAYPIPTITIDTKLFLLELRYNYDWEGTYSIYVAPTFYFSKNKAISLQPLLGYTFGKYNGASLVLRINIDKNQFDIISDHQYTTPLNQKNPFFSFP